jgi:hypothetical protein
VQHRQTFPEIQKSLKSLVWNQLVGHLGRSRGGPAF